MPFEKKWDSYESPSWKKYTEKQVKMYYASKWFKKRMMKKRRKNDDGDHEYR